MPKRTIPIARLTVGMYLTGIDRSWFHTPFLRHRFLIKDEKEIAALRNAGIAQVVIDTDLGRNSDDTGSVSGETHEGAPVLPMAAKTGTRDNAVQPHETATPLLDRPSPVRLANHFSEAKHQRQEWIHRANALFEKTRATDVVEVAEVRQIVDGVMENLLERQAACLAVLGLRQPDPTLQEHGLTVCTLALALGKALNLSDAALRQLGIGALLHDIGLAKLPRNIIKRPRAMASAQQTLYQTHTDEGVGILQKSGAAEPEVVSIVKGHHRFDQTTPDVSNAGTGTDLVKLVSVIDQYDELTTGQTGLTPMSSNQVLTQLYQHFGSDPDWLLIVSSLIRIIGVYPLYSVVSLNTGELGVVAAITPGKAHLPYLYICRDELRRPCVPPKPLDLTQEPEGERRVKEVHDPRQCGINIEQVLKQVAA